MDSLPLISASAASLLFWTSLSSVAVLALSNRRTPVDGTILTPEFVQPGTLEQRAECVGVDAACSKAGSLGEELACRHKKLVTCYAQKRIPDGIATGYTASGGQKDKCLGMVAYGTDGIFTNRTTFPVCLAQNQSMSVPAGHPYRYVTRDFYKSYSLALPKGYMMPTGKKEVDGKTVYTVNGTDIPYGLNDHLVRLKRDYGYDVIPVYKYDGDGVMVQADLPSIPLQIRRYK